MLRRLPSGNVKTITPLGKAITEYLKNLNDQYPGVLAQFAIGQDTPTKEPIKGVPCVYSFGARLFAKFEVNSTPFTLKARVAHETNSAETNKDDTQFELEMNEKGPLSRSTSADDLLEAGLKLTKGDMLTILNSIAAIPPTYTLQNIRQLMIYRMNLTTHILPNCVELFNELLSTGYNGMPVPPDIQQMGRARISGAILFKLLNKAEHNGQKIPGTLQKFITTITNANTDTPDDIIATQMQDLAIHVEGILSIKALTKALQKNKITIDSELEMLSINLHNLPNKMEFEALNEHAFHIIITRLEYIRKKIRPYPETLLTYDAILVNFLHRTKPTFVAYPAIIERAITLLETIPIPLEASPPVKKHRNILAKNASTESSIREKHEALLAALTTEKANAEKEADLEKARRQAAIHRFNVRAKEAARAPLEKENKAKQLNEQNRTLSAGNLYATNTDEDTTSDSPEAHEIKSERPLSLRRGFSSFFKRPRAKSNGQNNIEPPEENANSREATPNPSPNTERKKSVNTETSINAETSPTYERRNRIYSQEEALPLHERTSQGPALFAAKPESNVAGSSPPKTHYSRRPEERRKVGMTKN